MFPKKYRLESRLGESFFANAKRIYSPLFVLYWQKRDDDQVKATVVVPKKRAPKATERSKIKRIVREVALPHLEKVKNVSLAIYLKASADQVSQERAQKELRELFFRLNGKIK